MAVVSDALTGIDADARERVLDWASKRFGVTRPTPWPASIGVPETPSDDSGDSSEIGEESTNSSATSYMHFADLYDDALPSTHPDRALVAAYWVQVLGGADSFTATEVNEALKNLGHGAPNITDALTSLQRRKPAHVRQLEKRGKSKQGRKVYKVTHNGIKAVEAMIRDQD